MPPVYARLDDNKWQCSIYNPRREFLTDEKEFSTDDADFPEWITSECGITDANGKRVQLYEFFKDIKSCKRGEHLTKKFVVYYLVVKDNRNASKNEYLSAVQIYIGLASKGVLDRWLTNATSHCRAIKDVMEEKWRSKAYDNLRNRCRKHHYLTVDCYLAMAWLHKFNNPIRKNGCQEEDTKDIQSHDFDMALFVIPRESQKDMEDYEKDLIKVHKAREHGLNRR